MATRILDPASEKRLKRLQRDLTKYSRSKEWDKRIKEEMRRPARDAERALRNEISRIPSRGTSAKLGRESLRRQMINAVQSDVATSRLFTGAWIYVDAYKMPTGRENLPAYMNRTRRYTRWRVQVFGSDTWVTQKSHPFLDRAAKPFEKEVERVAQRVIDEIERDIAK